MKKPKVLAVVDYYLPGYKGGGPILSVSRMVKALGSSVDFCVFTRDRDLGDTSPYDGIRADDWNLTLGAPVYYASPKNVSRAGMLKAISDCNPDVIYVNSYFSKTTRIALWLRRMGKLKGIKLVVAPRGEFSKGALRIKSIKKSAYMAVADKLGFHDDVLWHVSTEHEKCDALAVIERDPKVYVMAPDIVDVSELDSASIVKPIKQPSRAEFCWISRVAPIKNLVGSIEALMTVAGDVTFVVYGPAEDGDYWSACQEAAAKLPPNVKFEYRGGIPSTEVRKSLSQHHFFLFRTFGENFGHVIPEALAAQCPLLLSDTTPWLDLDAKGVGHVLQVDDDEAWRQAVQRFVDMDDATYRVASAKCLDYLRNRSFARDVADNANLFERAMAS